MNGPNDRADLQGPPPEAQLGAGARSAPEAPSSPAPAQTSSFDLNYPTIVSLLYLASFVTGITAVVGVILAYVWKNEARDAWERSHYEYLINTFWIGLVGFVIGAILLMVLIGFLILPAVAVLVVVRCVLSLINAQKRAPMPNPSTLLA